MSVWAQISQTVGLRFSGLKMFEFVDYPREGGTGSPGTCRATLLLPAAGLLAWRAGMDSQSAQGSSQLAVQYARPCAGQGHRDKSDTQSHPREQPAPLLPEAVGEGGRKRRGTPRGHR